MCNLIFSYSFVKKIYIYKFFRINPVLQMKLFLCHGYGLLYIGQILMSNCFFKRHNLISVESVRITGFLCFSLSFFLKSYLGWKDGLAFRILAVLLEDLSLEPITHTLAYVVQLPMTPAPRNLLASINIYTYDVDICNILESILSYSLSF